MIEYTEYSLDSVFVTTTEFVEKDLFAKLMDKSQIEGYKFEVSTVTGGFKIGYDIFYAVLDDMVASKRSNIEAIDYAED